MKIIKINRNSNVPKNYTGIVEYPNGSKHWFLKGQLHREDDPAIEWPDGLKEWYRHGKLHREDGPAVEYADGEKFWLSNGKLHREHGPAIEYLDGTNSYYYNEIELNKERIQFFMKDLDFSIEIAIILVYNEQIK